VVTGAGVGSSGWREEIWKYEMYLGGFLEKILMPIVT
jgi:hypothetical protein